MKIKLNYRRQSLCFLHRNFMQGLEITTWYKKDLHNPDNLYSVITHLEPDILECEIKRALGSISTNKATGGEGIPVERFQILKDDAMTGCTQYASKFGKCSSGHRTGKGVFTLIQKKGNPKECSNSAQILHNCTHLTC